MNAVYNYLNDFLSLFFPDLCCGCGINLVSNESTICTNCTFHLPYTNYYKEPDNRVARQFWGRVPFIHCSAFLHFRKGSKVQNLMHQLKYNNKTDVGLKLGQMYGDQLLRAFESSKPDLIIPVPLHKAKEKKRGYNQSSFFAEGLAIALDIPVDSSSLQRNTFTDSQTRKSRFNRYENMQEVFAVAIPDTLEGKHVLLVDDIITTGATIESCAKALLAIPKVQLSIAAIAFTD
ncbi:ComF family protein [Pedobacter sp. SYSU D00535]|uniref:ComF family protein n=1 Tax=Pedobacter sp. SYSU D00535 TaxID=2810308 RepID=UPI001A9750DC|nr:phosphoribosyltransferase family protein [Pedobacter sp. SYSU D00535]